MKNVCVAITARPSYARIKTVLDELHWARDINLQLVVAGSLASPGILNSSQIASDFPVTLTLPTTLEGRSHASMVDSTAILLTKLSSAFETLKPDLVLVIADRYETLAVSIAASYMNIPLLHIQAGETTGSIDNKVRWVNSALADYYTTCTQHAYDTMWLRHTGDVVHTGCPSVDIALTKYLNHWDLLDIPGAGCDIKVSDDYYIIMYHPDTTEAANLRHVNIIAKVLDWIHPAKAFYMWPNVDAGAHEIVNFVKESFNDNNLYCVTNVDPETFYPMLGHSQGIIGNSSVAIRECSAIGVPAINIGNRQQGREQGHNVINLSNDFSEYDFMNALHGLEYHPHLKRKSDLYGSGNAGKATYQFIEDILND